MKDNNTIYAAYKDSRRLIKALGLESLVKSRRYFIVKVLNRTIVLYDDKHYAKTER